MKKVFLYAYDRINLGDDLFIHTICNRYPEVKFYLWSKKYNRRTFAEIKNLKILAQDSKALSLLKGIHPSLFSKYKAHMENKCDAVVYIGGSIFIEYENWEQILSWWDYEALNRKFYILGANFGPYKTESYHNKLADILHNVEDICFRDKYSYNLFSDIDTVRYAPDILFDYKFTKRTVKKQLFVSIIDCFSRNSGLDIISNNEEAYFSLLTNYINEYVNSDYSVIVSSFCKEEKDEDAIGKLLMRISINTSDKIQILNYNGKNIEAITDAIAESEFIIASRFHATVLGLAAGRPVLPVVYSDKTINILEDLNFKGRYIDIRKLTNSSYVATSEIDCGNQKVNNIKALKNESKKHFKKLDIALE